MKKSQSLLNVTNILFVVLIVIVTSFGLVACGSDNEEKNHIFNNVYFDYTNNVAGSDTRFLYLNNSGGDFTNGEYTHNVIIDSSLNHFSVLLSSFKTEGQNITINFENYPSVHGTFNESWTEVTFNDSFPLSTNNGWRFVVRD